MQLSSTSIVSASHDDPDIAALLGDLKVLGAKALLPAVMSAVDVGADEEVRQLLLALISFYVRHNVIGNLENSRLETVAFRLAYALRQDRDFAAAQQALLDAVPSLERFESQFGVATVSRQKSARYLLEKLELRIRATEELDVAPPHRVHLEHIYPQKPRLAKWPRHVQIINRLGNLTLLSSRLNQGIRNGPFEEKVDAYRESELLLTRALAELESWGAEAVERRQRELARQAREIWAFEGEE